MVISKNRFFIFILSLIFATFIAGQELEANKTKSTMIGILNDSQVRIRKDPNLEGEHIGYLNKDQIVYVVDETNNSMKIGKMDSKWYKVRTFEGIEGWSYGAFIDLGFEINSDPLNINSIFLCKVALSEGFKLKLVYLKDKQLFKQTDWMDSSDYIVIHGKERIILGDTYYPSDESYTYIFDFDLNEIKEFRNPGITYQFMQVEHSTLFYLIIFDGMDNEFSAKNKCIVYDSNGSIVMQYSYSSKEKYQFKYKEESYYINLIQPDLP